MTEITIAQALAEIDYNVHEGKPVEFSIEFVKESTGEIRLIKRASKAAKQGRSAGKSAKRSGFKYNVKEKGVLLVYDVDLEEYRSIKIPLIIRYNNKKVRH